MLKFTEPRLWNSSIPRITYFNNRNETILIIQHDNKFCSTGHQVLLYLYDQGRLTLNVPVATNQTCTKTL